MLNVENLSVHYGVIEAVKQVNFEVNQGEIVTLIGANGAGKTTILKAISGILPISRGEIIFEGQSLKKESSSKIVERGIGHVPEGRHVFGGMTVQENFDMGAFLRKDKENVQADIDQVFKRFPILKERINQDASTLSGGEQQMLAMGRALLSRPKLLLLDEPSMGLAPLFIREIFRLIEAINADGTTILLVEQNARASLQIADRGYILETGKVTATGTGKELLGSESVQKAYLGG